MYIKPLHQTSLYLKHPSISNIPLSQTSLYLKHLSISNIPLSQTSLYLKHLSISNIPLSQTSLYLKHLSITNIPKQNKYLRYLFDLVSEFLLSSFHVVLRLEDAGEYEFPVFRDGLLELAILTVLLRALSR